MITHEPITLGAILKNFLYIPAVLIGLSPESYAILTVFMFLDLCLGVIRVAILYGPNAIKSYKLTAGLISKLLVLSVPLIVVWAGKGAGVDLAIMGQWSIGVLVLAQAYSILGHIAAIRGKQEKSEWDAVAAIQGRLRGALEALLMDSHNKEK